MGGISRCLGFTFFFFSVNVADLTLLLMEFLLTPGFFGRAAVTGETPEEGGILQPAKGPWLILAVKARGRLCHVSEWDFICLLVPVLGLHRQKYSSPACSLSQVKDLLVIHLLGSK